MKLGRRIGDRAKTAWYLAQDVGYAAGRLARRAGAEVGDLWWGLDLRARQRIAGLAALGALAALVVLLVVPNLPCELPGGDECPPDDEAIELVPANALAYVHANVDPETEQGEKASALAKRLRTIADQIVVRLPGPTGAAIDYRRDVTRWLGGEGALAVVGAESGEAERVVLLEAGDTRRAKRFARELTARDAGRDRHRGVEMRIGAGGVAAALTSGFLVVGPTDAVRSVIDVAEGPARPLDDSEAATDALDALPDDRLAEAYVSEDGIGDLLAGEPSLALLEAFVNFQASTGAVAALVAHDDGIEVEVHSVLDESREKAAPGFFGAFPRFEPGLTGEVSESALAYLALGSPEQSVKALLAQATAEAPALASAFEEFSDRLRAAGGVSLEKEVLPLLEAQAAVAVEPPPARKRGGRRRRGAPESELPLPGGAEAPPGAPNPGSAAAAPPGVPHVSLIVDEVDERKASRTLAQLQGPLAGALEAERTGQAPVFGEREIDGVTARSLRVSPTVNLTYAVFDGMLVVSTDPAGVEQVKNGTSSLDGSGPFEEVTGDFPGELSALVYLNLGGLIELAERAGLAADPSYALFAPEIRKLEALGLAVEREKGSIDTELRVAIN